MDFRTHKLKKTLILIVFFLFFFYNKENIKDRENKFKKLYLGKINVKMLIVLELKDQQFEKFKENLNFLKKIRLKEN